MGAGAQRVNELWDAMFVVGTATEDGSGGKGHVEGVPGDVPPCDHGALPGFSSGVASGDRVAIMRRRGVAVSLGSLLKPAGEQVNDRTIWTPTGLQARFRGKVLKVEGSEAVDGILLDGTVKVVRDGDVVPPTAAEVVWKGQVAMFINAIVPGYIAPPTVDPIGTCTASTTKVKAG